MKKESLNQKRIYLDYNATSPTRPEAINAVKEMMELGGNPSSVHSDGRLARAKLNQARLEIAAFIDARPEDVIFTSGGTEANNIAIQGIGAKHLITLKSEHDSIVAGTHKFSGDVSVLPVTIDGLVSMEALENILKEKGEGTLVSIMFANNETGVIHPIKEIGKLVHSYGARIHTDAVQAAGKMNVSFKELDVDLMSISSHKIGGPQGVGALIAKYDIPLNPIMVGGGQEGGRRTGTENLPGIVGFGCAANLAPSDFGKYAEIEKLRDNLQNQILAYSPESIVFGKEAPRLPNTLSITMPGVQGETQVMAMDLGGISVSAGSACTSGKVKASHVLLAMLNQKEAADAIRISMGTKTSKEDIEYFFEAWKNLYDRTHKSS